MNQSELKGDLKRAKTSQKMQNELQEDLKRVKLTPQKSKQVKRQPKKKTKWAKTAKTTQNKL